MNEAGSWGGCASNFLAADLAPQRQCLISAATCSSGSTKYDFDIWTWALIYVNAKAANAHLDSDHCTVAHQEWFTPLYHFVCQWMSGSCLFSRIIPQNVLWTALVGTFWKNDCISERKYETVKTIKGRTRTHCVLFFFSAFANKTFSKLR